MTRNICLKAPAFLGDEIVLTGVVRDLSAASAGLSIFVSTRNPELWSGNPHIAGVNPQATEEKKEAIEVFAHDLCPSWRKYSQTPVHYLQAYLQTVAQTLKVKASVTAFKGDVYPDPSWGHRDLPDLPERYWLVVPGCKTNVPVKGWGTQNYQAVVDAMRGQLQFIQVGTRADWFPPLNGVVNMVGRTDIRDLVNLVSRAEGVLCPITSLMHLAAALPTDETRSKFTVRPCVVLAGGRESPHYISYPGHRVLANVGTLPCCLTGGCGQSAFSNGDPTRGCRFPVAMGTSVIPKCLSLIKPAQVLQAIESFYAGELMQLPRRAQRAQAIFKHMRKLQPMESSPVGAEIGVRKGDMSAALLRGHSALKMLLVDPWTNFDSESYTFQTDPQFYGRNRAEFEREYREALRNTKFAADRCVVMRELSVNAAQKVADGSLDFVFIDACHSYEGCKSDIEAWFPKLKIGGLLGGHDYFRPQYPREGVKRAVDEFAAKIDRAILTDVENTWFIYTGKEASLTSARW